MNIKQQDSPESRFAAGCPVVLLIQNIALKKVQKVYLLDFFIFQAFFALHLP